MKTLKLHLAARAAAMVVAGLAAGCGTLKDVPSDGVAQSGWQAVEPPPPSSPASLPVPAPVPAPKREQSVKAAPVSGREAAASAAAPSAKAAAMASESRAVAVPPRWSRDLRDMLVESIGVSDERSAKSVVYSIPLDIPGKIGTAGMYNVPVG